MEIIDFSDGERRMISEKEIGKFEKPVLLYLGCLHHLQDIDTGGHFPHYMAKLRGPADAHIVAPLTATQALTA